MALLSTIFQALLRKGALLGVFVLLIIGIVEVALWLFAPVAPHADYEFTFKNAMTPYGLEESSRYEIDSREVRTRPSAEDRSERVKMLILGGEGTAQPLQSVGDTVWGRVATEIERQFPHVGLDVSVKASNTSNARGTSLKRALSWAKTYAPELEPDIMVVSFGISEVLDVPEAFRYNPTTMQTLPALARPSSIKDKIVRVSQLARRVRLSRKAGSKALAERKAQWEKQDFFLMSLGQKQRVFRSLPFDAQPPRWAPEHDPKLEYLDGIRALKALAMRLGAEFIVVGEPTLHDADLSFDGIDRLNRPRWIKRPTIEDPNGVGMRPDPAWVELELNRFYEAADDWAAKEGLSFVNLNQNHVLPKTVANFVDETMLNQAGSQRVADEVSPAVTSSIKKVLAK
ncbi:MAG: hypothetical protein P1U82_00045 [Verrucomicrobiales bacterium]|jgi:hypothetical protein|nr:hypothetical protein [Verrucomicrobiales bacterium]